MWDEIAGRAARESSLWAGALRTSKQRVEEAVFSPLGPDAYALGIETIYEGYLVHFGRSRLFAPPDEDTALLLGDYLYAQGLVHVAATGNVAAVADLAELISLVGQARAVGRDGDGAAWAATAALLGRNALESPREALRERGDSSELDSAARRASGDEAVDRSLAAHARLVL